MENAPVTFFRGRNVPDDLRERYQNWMFEAYIPILLKIPGLEAVEYYRIVKENPLYPPLLGLYHYNYSLLPAGISRMDSPDWQAVMEDQAKTFSRVEQFWSQHYILRRRFHQPTQPLTGDMPSRDAPIIHLEAFKLSPGEGENFNDWFVKWAYRVYIPVLMMLPGLIEYHHYQPYERDKTRLHQLTGKPVVTEYPQSLSVLHFENLEAFENYENSPALVAFRRALSLDVPGNLVTEWDVQYRLVRRWRK
jgi:hypothetical protein